MLLFQICIPFAIEHFKLRTTIKSFLHYWFTAVGWALGLTDFLLPRPDNNGAQENANGEPARQALNTALVDDIAQRDQPLRIYGPGDRPLRVNVPEDQALRSVNGAIARINGSTSSNVPDEYDADDQSDSE